jgi:hypothetical protein
MRSLEEIPAGRLPAPRSDSPVKGIHAKSVVIDGENPASLVALTAEYYERFCPKQPERRALVDSLIASEWLLRRFRRAEAELWKHNQPARQFALLQRRIDSTQRTYERVLALLLTLDGPPHPDEAVRHAQLGLVG